MRALFYAINKIQFCEEMGYESSIPFYQNMKKEALAVLGY